MGLFLLGNYLHPGRLHKTIAFPPPSYDQSTVHISCQKSNYQFWLENFIYNSYISRILPVDILVFIAAITTRKNGKKGWMILSWMCDDWWGVANQVIKVDKKFLKKQRENAKLKIISLQGQSAPGCKLLTSQARFHSITAGISGQYLFSESLWWFRSAYLLSWCISN